MESKITEFVTLTNATSDQAKFYLEAAKGDLDIAITNYFDSGDSSEPAKASTAPVQAVSTNKAKGKASSGEYARVKTFNEIRADSESDSDDGKKDNTYFAGGDKSGVLIKGPPKGGKGDAGAGDLVQKILGQAARAGPVPEEFEAKAKPKWFTGAGVKLGSTGSGSAAVPAANSDDEGALLPVERVLTFWQDGFSIDDGELLSYDDPANKDALEAIKDGRAPSSLMNVKYGQPVNVKVAHRMQEKYQPQPKKPLKPFSGSGQRLGSIVPGSTSGSATKPSLSSTVGVPKLDVDASKPTTSVQIRLHDGSKLVARFNHTHTVQDIINFINTSSPDQARLQYRLFAGFPMKELSSKSQTLAEANLLNSVVVQKL